MIYRDSKGRFCKKEHAVNVAEIMKIYTVEQGGYEKHYFYYY